MSPLLRIWLAAICLLIPTIPATAQKIAPPLGDKGATGGKSAAPNLQHQDNGESAAINGRVARNRNWYEQPGGNGSAWNTPFGSGATWGAATDADTIDIARGWNGSRHIAGPYGNINATAHWGFTLWVGHASDPTYQITYENGRTKGPDSASGNVTETIHIPNGAYSPGPFPGDNSFGVMDVAAVRMYGFGLPVPPPGLSGGGSYQDGLGEWDDPTSEVMGHDWDTGLSGYVVALGAINYCDVNPSCNPFYPKIKHALRYSTDAHLLKSCTADRSMACPGTSWPQRLQDYQAGVNYYTGNLVAGTTLGIPMTTPMPSGLDANCQGAFWTFQHYPLFFRDQGGGGFNLTADQVADTSSYVASLRVCLPQLVSLLRPMRNQHVGGRSFKTSPINGPGARVDTGPNPLIGSAREPNHHR